MVEYRAREVEPGRRFIGKNAATLILQRVDLKALRENPGQYQDYVGMCEDIAAGALTNIPLHSVLPSIEEATSIVALERETLALGNYVYTPCGYAILWSRKDQGEDRYDIVRLRVRPGFRGEYIGALLASAILANLDPASRLRDYGRIAGLLGYDQPQSSNGPPVTAAGGEGLQTVQEAQSLIRQLFPNAPPVPGQEPVNIAFRPEHLPLPNPNS